jgi:hypothetical protein
VRPLPWPRALLAARPPGRAPSRRAQPPAAPLPGAIAPERTRPRPRAPGERELGLHLVPK